MFWDKIACVYDLFENLYNRKVYNGTGRKAASFLSAEDNVLECACGTGAISIFLAKKCRHLTATDFSKNMLKQAQKKLSICENVTFYTANLMNLSFADQSFDAVVAGNVIHLLDDPKLALKELQRVLKPGGKLIIPTYINNSKRSNRAAVHFLEMLGLRFKRQFDAASYEAFFYKLGYEQSHFYIVDGKMACDIAVIENN